jgi:predicted transcriptional regulator of viral defense system
LAAIDRELWQLAARQHGVVTTRQLRAMGMSKSAISRRVGDRRLLRVHRGVYAVGHQIATVKARWVAALLALGPDACLSHRDAAALHDLRRSDRRSVDVTVPRRGHRHLDGITVHVTEQLHPNDRSVVDKIPVTSGRSDLARPRSAPTRRRSGFELLERSNGR